MKQEIEVSGKTIDDAVSKGASMLGVDPRLVTYEVICAPKKGFLGFGETPATVRVSYEAGAEITALNFIRHLMEGMGIEAESAVKSVPGKEGILIDITGEEAGILIGHHGETLDALQYLVNLAANKREENEESKDYCRITVDVENYRAKREETLRQLARRMAGRVLKYKKSITLEPMNPYERRIIHAEVQKINGVSTNSIGADHNRRVVIFLTDRPQTGNGEGNENGDRGEKIGIDAGNSEGARRHRRRRRKPDYDREKTENGTGIDETAESGEAEAAFTETQSEAMQILTASAQSDSSQ